MGDDFGLNYGGDRKYKAEQARGTLRGHIEEGSNNSKIKKVLCGYDKNHYLHCLVRKEGSEKLIHGGAKT